ncbi:MAG TPA: hypothetical protein VGB95_06290 [Chitinophagales bacterium]
MTHDCENSDYEELVYSPKKHDWVSKDGKSFSYSYRKADRTYIEQNTNPKISFYAASFQFFWIFTAK